jgi:hypothetical protein
MLSAGKEFDFHLEAIAGLARHQHLRAALRATSFPIQR